MGEVVDLVVAGVVVVAGFLVLAAHHRGDCGGPSPLPRVFWNLVAVWCCAQRRHRGHRRHQHRGRRRPGRRGRGQYRLRT